MKKLLFTYCMLLSVTIFANHPFGTETIVDDTMCDLQATISNVSCGGSFITYDIFVVGTDFPGTEFGTYVRSGPTTNLLTTFPLNETVTITEYNGAAQSIFATIFDPADETSCIETVLVNCADSGNCSINATVFGVDCNPPYVTYTVVVTGDNTSGQWGTNVLNEDGSSTLLSFSYGETAEITAFIGAANGTFIYTLFDLVEGAANCGTTIDIDCSIVEPGLTITCPDDVTLQIPDGNNSIEATWSLPSGTTTCPNGFTVAQTAGPANGGLLTEGVYTISFQGSNDCNNNVSCSFDITVIGADPSSCTITAEGLNGVLTINGLNGNFNTKVFDTDYNVVWDCNPWDGSTCTSEEIISALTQGATYFVSAVSDDCQEFITVVIVTEGCTDNDADGFCDFEDCDDNDPNFPQPVGNSCDDGDPTTTEDVIQEDGCTCAGIVDVVCDVNAYSFNNAIEITGLTAQENTKVFDADYNVVWECNPWEGSPCSSFELIPDLVEGATYFVSFSSADCLGFIPVVIFSGIPDNNLIAANEVEEADGFKLKNLFPNPTFGDLYVHIESEDLAESFVQVFDLNGKIVFEKNLAIAKGINAYNFDLSELQAGMYQVLIHADKKVIKERFVKMRN